MKGSSYTALLNKSTGKKQWPPGSPSASDVIIFVGLYHTGSPQIKTKNTKSSRLQKSMRNADVYVEIWH
jgi:hypothetical protein